MTASLSPWQQGALLDLTIADLSNGGDGVGRWEGRVVFVPDTVPGDRVTVRLVRVKPQYAYGKLHEIHTASPHRVRPSCIVADKCGGCQWQSVAYDYQLEAKRNLVVQDLERIGGFTQPPVEPVLAVSDALGYRNKATYPLARSSSGQVQAGYYQKASHQLINLNQCPIQDVRLNPLLAEVKQDIQQRGWSIYNETEHRGKLRHLGLRIGRRTGEILLTLVARDANLAGLEEQAQEWLTRYPELVGVCLNLNADRTNAIFGNETRCIAGQPYLRETFAGLQFHIQPATFFQVNTEQTEALLNVIQQKLNLQGTEILVDAYCGIGTLTLPLARQAKEAIAIEVQLEAVEQARLNAQLNGITNVSFQIGAVEDLLPRLTVQPEVVLLDPPRKGCDSRVIETLLTLLPDRIVYVSCNSATLARDLKGLSDRYTLLRVQPADFFPQTAHVECVAFLIRR
ncbi:23S rRNA (uracil(1939)-C(5))-methyltransferase RlmD [Phormidium tenue FACHB-886]|nr:23S rRNA (uracil(1939)-C(5))-methyltransferase RlmD [Phormidium tenue FACHB-886]